MDTGAYDSALPPSIILNKTKPSRMKSEGGHEMRGSMSGERGEKGSEKPGDESGETRGRCK